MSSSGNNLCEELMIEILLRLPPQCVARFKCVSKYWYALINDPKFVDSLQRRNLIIKRTVTNEQSGEKETMFTFLKIPLADVVVEDDFQLPKVFQYCEFRGRSHGLICLSDNPGNIFLCNPATRELRRLPPSILLQPCDDPFGPDTMTDAVGFGYDPKCRDFKVVRVVEFCDEGPGYCPCGRRTEVYDLGKDGWREIESPTCGSVFWMPSCEMYHEGLYYWWAVDDGRREIIQTFDMSEEVFGRIPVPESFVIWNDKCRSMGVWKGRIVLFYYDYNAAAGFGKTFEIWAMEKHNYNYSWSKVFTIGPISGIESPLVFVSCDELIMEAKEGQLILYNLNTQRFVQLPVKGLHIKDSVVSCR